MRLVLVQAQLRHDADGANLDRIRKLLDAARIDFAPSDVLLLPERFELREAAEPYERDVRTLAQSFGCHVVGGSHHETRPGGSVNAGIVADPTGAIVGRYEKLRPYALERQFVEPGTLLGELTIDDRHVLILICADFWFVDLVLRATRAPDLVLVPALSVTRHSTPDYSRALWRHLAISRAYEFGTYVGVSDWAYPSELPILFTAGAGGLADPTTVDPERFFTPIAPAGAPGVTVHDLDFAALDAFRHDRISRGFFWK
jgi:predicted amidohydrolase